MSSLSGLALPTHKVSYHSSMSAHAKKVKPKPPPLLAIAAQERKVMELREELQRAETDLTRLKEKWIHEDQAKKNAETKDPDEPQLRLRSRRSLWRLYSLYHMQETDTQEGSQASLDNRYTPVAAPQCTAISVFGRRFLQGSRMRKLSLVSLYAEAGKSQPNKETHIDHEKGWISPQKWWEYLDLDSHSVLMMLKGALAPTITIAIYQSNAISDITSTIGYLSALISVLSQGLMPRAKFMKIMFFDLLSTCVSASLCCLAVFCAVKAREHTTSPDASEAVRTGYNSDACAVSAIWLIFMIWGANSLRALKPMELQDPMVAFSIFASVTITRAGMFTSLAEGLEFVSRLLKGFMIGFAIATGVSLLILPITSRDNVFHDVRSADADADADAGTGVNQGPAGQSETDLQSKVKALQGSVTKLNGLHIKLHADVFYSRDEIAWGKLSAVDLSDIASLFRSLLLPLSGMSMLPEILEMIVKNGSPREGPFLQKSRNQDRADRADLGEISNEMVKVVETHHARLLDAACLVRLGLEHFLLALELISAKHLAKKKTHRGVLDWDEEARGERLCPGQSTFTSRFEGELHAYYSRRKQLPEALASLEAFSEKHVEGESVFSTDPDVRQEFFLILYMGHLQDDLLSATLRLVPFAERKVQDGTMARGRLIFPKPKSVREWLSLNIGKKDGQSPSASRQSSHFDPSNILRDELSTGFPDPEHLPPEKAWEKGSIILRKISHSLKSDQSTFGFRVAAASFSVGILAYLHQTQDFFIRQRCIWAMIVIVIEMNPTSGQTMFGFVVRIAATVISLALSLIVWYIVDGKTAGVIVFLYLANVFEYYFYVKVPQYFGAAVISIVTLDVIVGYELQVKKIGVTAAESNGQPYYQIYLFGPYKLAAVAAGCAISFFWVIFPYPITAKSQLRKLLGRSLFILAKFYSCMHTTIELWFTGDLGNADDKTSPGHQLLVSRHKIFKEEMMLLTELRMHSLFSIFEPPIGGKFPKQIYDNIIGEIQQILTSMSLMAHTTQGLDTLAIESEHSGHDGNEQWMARLAEIALKSADFNSHRITSLLCHLSAAIMNSQPLPPYLSTPDSFPLARQMQKIDDELLSIRHIEDPAFSAFVSLEVLRSVVSFSLQDLIGNVKKLVGELNFDFDIRHTQRHAESAQLLHHNEEHD
ncbi:hypothetical protein N7532_000993 [Penicillium argentinense]|uniref:ER transporter 6TM N-terminal domain-containing protein n=1 Tax=Penicillium argentinense TaxID=1131581 RepID=A0A9W9KM09_9EURO|nr:uncharacterized protein N7532_000993 [Penicillium argentinense]KAJ5110458.1 hypothetical protein N7532_000993 [Penicillium argentinense]